MRILGAVCASILATSLGTLAACGGSPESKEPTTAQAVSAASVSIALFDANGTRVGEGSGVMIAPRLVLTSGHLISGKHKWVVTSADGKQKATGSRGMTYDWMKYDSNKAHPRKHDIGVIHLAESIKLSAYPKLVGEKSADGTKATRVRGTGAGFEQHDMTLAKYRTSPNAWLGDGLAGETLDTGGAVYDSRGILGIVSGRGMTTGKLYVARVDGLVKWLAPKVACAGGATGVRTYAGPSVDKSKEICEDAGTGTGASSGNPGGGDGTTSGGPGSDGSGPGDDSGGSCEGNNDGVCSGSCGAGGNDGSGGTNGSSGPNGSTGPSGPGGDGTPGSSGGPGSGGDGNGGTNGSNPGGDGTPGSSGAPGSDGSSGPGGDGTPGSSGAPGSQGSSGNNGNSGDGSTNGNTSSSGGNTGGAGGSQGTVPGSDNGGGDEGEACQGPNDNPDVCPPEPDGCVGPGCGGGQPDDSIDYGNCACGSSGGDGIYLR